MKEDQEHLTICEGYQELREDADLGNEQELVEFFGRVMAKRKEMKWDKAVQDRCTAAQLVFFYCNSQIFL